jgi:hypothetical protein
MFCARCEAQVLPDVLYCSSCGAPIRPAPSELQPSATSRRKRPRLVWVISLFYIFFVATTLLSFFLVFSGAVPTDPPTQAYFHNLGVFDHLSTIALGIITLTATISLFRLRRSAVALFTTALAFNVALTAFHAVAKGWTQASGGTGLIATSLAWLTLGAIIAYARRLAKRGVLA